MISIFLLSTRSTVADAKGPISIAGSEYATQRSEVEIAEPVTSNNFIRKTKFIIFIVNCEKI